ncbi:phosphomannomutase CpsG [Xenorhabdus bovienii]|nr:phosphomannomutase CpsG [Xenorhabdus bovienii]MDE1482439.1 phosphomannomutase CpsG [Xenorhabdus bovienii]MDE9458273.1 phosphomannomutase CpsG [Xenorhabdus bovienii]MDE9514339.1 phosphomannomutase CpsG [Xenorhabdus bovienii]
MHLLDKCFKAYDIRGKVDSELTDEVMYRIGYAFANYVRAKDIVIGSDVRLSSDRLKKSFANGVMDYGSNIIDIGLVGTEEIYFATTYLNADGGVEITASHNPIDYNGAKFVLKNSTPISSETGLNEIKKIASSLIIPFTMKNKKGTYKKLDLTNEYIKNIVNFLDLDKVKPIKITVNTGNGAAGHIIESLEKKFEELNVPISFNKINIKEDGSFPNGVPNPLLPECRVDTSNAVISSKSDFGIAFDGDFDRCFFFDENGQFIEGYYIVGLLAEIFLLKYPGEKIIHDPRLTWNTIELVQKHAGIPVVSKTGHAYIKEKMRRENAIYGGEMSAHHYFRDFNYCDSGMIPWLLIIELLSKKDKKISQLVDNMIVKYPVSGEINIHVKNSTNIIEKVLKKYKETAIFIDYIDGLSMEFKCWRFNLRISNTEDLLRLNVESRENRELVEIKKKEIMDLISNNEIYE